MIEMIADDLKMVEMILLMLAEWMIRCGKETAPSPPASCRVTEQV